MKKSFSTALLIVVFSSAALKVSAQKWNKINRTEYSIQSPVDWTIDSSRKMGTDLVLFAMLENSTDQFRENVNVLIQNISGRNIDLSQYTNISVNQIKAMAADAAILESGTVKKGNITYQKMVYTASQSGFKLKFEQYYFITKSKAYVVTLTTEVNKFDTYKLTGEAILNSFVVK